MIVPFEIDNINYQIAQLQSGGAGGSGNLEIPVTVNQKTNNNIYSVVGAIKLNMNDYPGKSVKFAVSGYVVVSGDSLMVRLYNVTDVKTESEITIETNLINTIKSDNLILSGEKIYEVQIKNGKTAPNYVVLSTAFLEITS